MKKYLKHILILSILTYGTITPRHQKPRDPSKTDENIKKLTLKYNNWSNKLKSDSIVNKLQNFGRTEPCPWSFYDILKSIFSFFFYHREVIKNRAIYDSPQVYSLHVARKIIDQDIRKLENYNRSQKYKKPIDVSQAIDILKILDEIIIISKPYSEEQDKLDIQINELEKIELGKEKNSIARDKLHQIKKRKVSP